MSALGTLVTRRSPYNAASLTSLPQGPEVLHLPRMGWFLQLRVSPG